MMSSRRVAMLLLIAIAIHEARAEILWLQPETTRATPGASIGLTVNLSDSFRGASSLLPASRIERARVTLAGETSAPASWTGIAGALHSSVTLTRPGVAVAELRLQPEARSISRGDVDRYLVALHANDEIQAAWQTIAPPNPWQEIGTTVLKSHVRVGLPPAADRAWLAPSASGLDMVPVADPTAVRSNVPFSVRVMRDGKPVANVAVEFLSEDEAREHVSVTDDAGTAAATLDRVGAWLIRCFDVRRVNASNHDWETDTVVLMVLTSG